MSYRIIVADNQDMFRIGTARLLGVEDDFRIVGQCSDVPSLVKTTENFPGAIVLCARSLGDNWTALQAALTNLQCRLVAVLENSGSASSANLAEAEGILYRNVTPLELVACVRAVGGGGRHLQRNPASRTPLAEVDPLGERARKRLTRKELQIVALLVQGYKNKDIADELGNTEQVIKNYMRSIFDKTGVADRLELALFVIHHKVLLAPGMPVAPSAPEKDQFLQRASRASSAAGAAPQPGLGRFLGTAAAAL